MAQLLPAVTAELSLFGCYLVHCFVLCILNCMAWFWWDRLLSQAASLFILICFCIDLITIWPRLSLIFYIIYGPIAFLLLILALYLLHQTAPSLLCCHPPVWDILCGKLPNLNMCCPNFVEATLPSFVVIFGMSRFCLVLIWVFYICHMCVFSCPIFSPLNAQLRLFRIRSFVISDLELSIYLLTFAR